MAKFLVTYHGGELPTDDAAIAGAREEFGRWLQDAGTAVLDPGSALRPVTQLTGGEPGQLTEIAGYTMLEADSVQAALTLLTSHPFLGRGGTLQLNEVV
jgi:hypothetical protein